MSPLLSVAPSTVQIDPGLAGDRTEVSRAGVSVAGNNLRAPLLPSAVVSCGDGNICLLCAL